MNYRQKYLKYKTKYLKLKGGMDNIGESSDIFNNPDTINEEESGDINHATGDKQDDVCSNKKYYLPCEITSITQKLFMTDDMIGRIHKITDDINNKNIFTNIIIMNFKDYEITYYQDPFIFLKNNNKQNKDIVFIKNEKRINEFNFGDNIDHINIDMLTESDLGGNFLASPKVEKNKSVVFYLDGISDPIKSAFDEYLDQELVELKCSFTIGRSRHIDEIMTFMPYGLNKFKVWIYYVRKIEFTNKYVEMYTLDDTQRQINEANILKLNNKIISIKDIDIKKFVIKIRDDIIKLNKSSSNIPIIDYEDFIKINIFDLDDIKFFKKYFIIDSKTGSKKFCLIDPITGLDKSHLYGFKTKLAMIKKLSNRLLTEINSDNIKLINNLLHIIKYDLSIDSIDIFNNITFNFDELEYLNKYINKNKNINSKLAYKNIEEIKNILYDEQKLNLDIISRKLFDSNYDDNKNNFVMFPIDLLITTKYNCIITSIPIFNRIWYETDKQCIALIPTGYNYDSEIMKTYNEEKTKIKSYINPNIEVEYCVINTQDYHEDYLPKDRLTGRFINDIDTAESAGGNLHCLIKNKY